MTEQQQRRPLQLRPPQQPQPQQEPKQRIRGQRMSQHTGGENNEKRGPKKTLKSDFS